MKDYGTDVEKFNEDHGVLKGCKLGRTAFSRVASLAAPSGPTTPNATHTTPTSSMAFPPYSATSEKPPLTPESETMTTTTRPLYEIAREIRQEWPNPYFGAVPYLKAFGQMHSIHDDYGHDDGRTLVLYFLSNAKTWRGEDARRIKAELKAMVR